MRFLSTVAAVGVAVLLPVYGASAATLIGPTGGSGLSGEYAGFSDSPFASVDFSGGYFYLEDFEDGLQNTLGVSADNGGVTSVVFGPSIHDSVDTDDGSKDGSGLAGDSYFSSPGSAGVTWTFDASALGELPTHAGLVWTDGSGTITFEAFDALGVSLGTVEGTHATSGNGGATNEDRFYGVIDFGGISKITLRNTGGGIELDHVQYGNSGAVSPIPLPASAWFLIVGLGGLAVARRKKNEVA